MTARWLGRLESLLPADSSIRDHFDLIAGTSTGAILACAVSHGIRAAEIESMYREHGDEIFPSRGARLWSRSRRFFTQGPSAPKFDGAGLERTLRRRFEDATFGQLGKPTLVTSYDTLTRRAVVMKTRGSPGPGRKRFDDVPVWEIARASCSAPSYLPAHVLRVGGIRMPLIDGGVVANNPTACAVAEAVRINQERDPEERVDLVDFVVASFGTGESTRPISVADAREWGALEWALPIIDVLFDGAAGSVDYIVRHLLAEQRYFRFQTRLEAANDAMDDASRTNLDALTRLADRYLDSGGANELTRLAGLLRRRGSARSPRF